MPIYKRLALALLALFFYTDCARVVNPTGGEKDVDPPKLLSSGPQHLSTNFKGQKAVLYFDEYLKLNNPSQNIIFAPLPKSKPLVTLKGQSIEIEFAEKLLENTTYSIFFGESIQDNNEGNTLKNFSLVFSTGPTLDSLELEGKVKHAKSDLAAEGIAVLAYTNTADSAILKESPAYVTFTKADGSYRFKYLPNDYFKVYALADQNGNYIKDVPNEAFDFISDSVKSGDSLPLPILRIYENEAPLARKKSSTYKSGILVINFNHAARLEEKSYRFLNGDTLAEFFGAEYSDSLLYCLEADFDDTLVNPFLNDTIRVRFSDRDKSYPLSWEFKGNQALWDSIYLKSAFAYQVNDSFSFCLKADSTVDCFSADSSMVETAKGLAIKPWLLDSAQNKLLFLKKGSVSGLAPFDRLFNDSIAIKLNKPDSSSFGSTTVTIYNPNKLKGFAQLSTEEQEIMRVNIQADDSEVLLQSPLLQPANYVLLFVEDLNQNGRWDPGEYAVEQKVKAERTMRYPGEMNVRANWVLDIDWTLELNEE